jgi:hypothetical protein
MAAAYCARELCYIGRCVGRNVRINTSVYNRLKALDICRPVRGCRGGVNLQRTIETVVTQRSYVVTHHGQGIPVNCNLSNLVKVSLTETCVQHPLRMACLNARSVKNKASEIAEYTVDKQIDICALTETWLSSGDRDRIVCGDILAPGYQLHQEPRKKGRGGGVAVLYKKDICVKKQHSATYSSFENMEVLIKTGSDCIRLIVVYRPPLGSKHAQPSSVFMEEFGQYIDSHTTTSGKLLVMGDFNFHVGDNTSPDANRLISLLHGMNMKQHVNEPTHVKGHVLDLVITRSSEPLIQHLQVLGAVISDHCPVMVDLPMQKPVSQKKEVQYRKVKAIDHTAFLQDLQESSLVKSPAPDLETLLAQYNSTLSDLLDKHAPFKSKLLTLRPYSPWYNDTIRAAQRSRRKAERRWRKSKLSIHLQLYQEEHQHVKDLCNAVKKEYCLLKLEEAGEDQKKLFQLATSLLYKSKCSALPSYTSEEHLANKFVDFFSDKIEKIRATFPQSSAPAKVTSPSTVPQLQILRPTTQEELKKIICSGNSKSCRLDPIPTTLLKAHLDCLLSPLCDIVNMSLSASLVPGCLKYATVTPLLKKSTLDKENFKKFRPVSNLPYVSKLIEKVVVARLEDHMTVYSLHEPYQSAYRKKHSTETALVCVTDSLLSALDNRECALLVLLDMSAAFDTIDHNLLFQRLETTIGVRDKALDWFKSYFSDRSQSVCINGVSSKAVLLPYGFPQGSVVGPFGFPPYSATLSKILEKHGVKYHYYADDTQIYIFFPPAEGVNAITRMEDCIQDVRVWMEQNFLKLNDSKTEFIVISKNHNASLLKDVKSLQIGNECIKSVPSARNIGAVIDSHLDMSDHIDAVCRACYMHLRHIGQIRPYLTENAASKIIHALISSKLDSFNSLLYGLPDVCLHRLQLVQNTAARIIKQCKKYDHITPILYSLHWLPVKERIEYKIVLLTFKSMHDMAPLYISELLQPYHPSCSLRSEDLVLLKQPKSRTRRYGDRAFSVCAPRLWNNLPLSLRKIDSLSTFRTTLKTHLFKRAYAPLI